MGPTHRGEERRNMYLGQVIGRCVATQKVPGLEGIRMLIVQPMSEDWKPIGPCEIACDSVQAGPGDRVFLVGSREASLALENTFVPVDAAIVGIVDSVDLEKS
jgi:ethanolamine utilization protein EutN